jgi:GT2 family glycosyltransferase
MNSSASVAIVLINWNGLADTRECLHSLQAVDYAEKRVIVVDNGSANDEAGTLEAELAGFAEVLRLPENTGFTGGANAGINAALTRGTEYVLILNNDTIVDPDFLRNLVSAAAELPDVAAVCPRAYFYDRPRVIYSTGGSVSLWRGVATQIGRGEEDTGDYDYVAERDYADGVCILMPASAIRKVGMFDDDYFAYWEETDWCVRAREKGLRSYYVPSARIWHKAARSRSPDAPFHYLYRRNALLFVRKRGSGLQKATALAMHLFVYGPAYFLRHPTRIGRAFTELKALFWHARNQPTRKSLV